MMVAFLAFLPFNVVFFFFTNFDSVYFRFDLTLFTFRLLNFVIDIPSYARLLPGNKINREERSVCHVAMVTKFLDDNKPKTSLKCICIVSYSVSINLSNVG